MILDLLTSRAFERVARSYARRARSASERAKAPAGSYHTRPENHANDFEKVYYDICILHISKRDLKREINCPLKLNETPAILFSFKLKCMLEVDRP